jgi:fatty-acyl-CoA synthase
MDELQIHAGKPSTIGGVLLAGAATFPDRAAIVFPDEQRTYAELLDDAMHIGRGLQALGVRAGDHVGILMPNCVDMVAAIFGIALAGAVATPLNARYRSTELSYVIENADLTVLLSSDIVQEHVDYAELLNEAFPGLTEANDPYELRPAGASMLRSIVMLGERPAPGMISRETFGSLAVRTPTAVIEAAAQRVRGEDVALLIYTSGTTANPKGCQLTHQGVTWIAREGGVCWTVRSGDVMWDPLPLFHMSSIIPLTFVIDAGATYMSMTHFDPAAALRQMRQHPPTLLFSCFPPVTMALINHLDWAATDLSQVRVWINIAPIETLRVMAGALPRAAQIGSYGITEGGGIISFNHAHETQRQLEETVGPPVPSAQVRIVGPTGIDLPLGAQGEILVRGIGVMKGYYRDPERSAQVLDADGWLHTGDLCSIDADGQISYIGRIKDMLKVGGENVAPAEIESYLSKHPGVQLVQVVGVPDDRLVEVPCAYIELREGYSAQPAEFIDYCRGQIAGFKVPRHVRIITEWPMSATKIKRFRLREMFLEEQGTLRR